MHMRQVLASAAASALVLVGLGTATATAATTVVAPTAATSAPTIPTASPAAIQFPSSPTDCSSTFFAGDYRLGPDQLPVFGPAGFELLGYRRTGDLTEQQLFSQYYDSTAHSWIYPPDSGYLIIAGRPVEIHLTLTPGQDIDRYGSEYGSFLAPEGLPYAMRAIPPQSLDSTPAAICNYHDYRVLKPFAVDAGPIAPWFGQPGLGLQYQLDASLVPGGPTVLNVMWLVANGYLQRL